MENREELNRIPCVVNEGTLYRHKDMIRILHDVGQVRYEELFKNQVVRQGEGYVMGVFASAQSASMFLNKRIYVNVKGFDHLKVSVDADGRTCFDLVNHSRTIRLVPQEDAVEGEKSAAAGTFVSPVPFLMERQGFRDSTSYDLLFEDETEDIDEES